MGRTLVVFVFFVIHSVALNHLCVTLTVQPAQQIASWCDMCLGIDVFMCTVRQEPEYPQVLFCSLDDDPIFMWQ